MKAASKPHWDEVVFNDIIDDSAFGPRFSGDAYDDGGNVATLRTTDISEDGRIAYHTMPLARLDETAFASHLLKPGDLVITRSGRVGTTAIFRGYDLPVLPGAFLIRFRLNKQAHPDFYRYWFNSRVGQQRLTSVARGVAQQNINITNVKTLKIPLPPISTQRRIAALLSVYDDLIENNYRRIQLLEESARLLYREWFVYLRFPGHEHVKVRDGVPGGWKKQRIGDVLTLNYGKALKSETRIEGAFPVYGSSGVVGSHDKAMVSGPGIIVGRKGNVGAIYWCSKEFWPIDTVYFVSKEESNLYLYYALQYAQFINTDVAVPGLNRDMAYSRKLLMPEESVLNAFLEEIRPIRDQIEKIEEFKSKLELARDLLLPRLMDGDIAA